MTEPDETAARDAVRHAHETDPEPVGFDVDAGLADVYTRAANPPFGLTRRELDVATLAAAGRTAVQIADQLSLSRQSVSRLLRRAYAKLGVTSRTDVGRALEPRARQD
ncbi:helix-turn-helix domain-containing protein [Kutzneria chonburiensis]|uniref:Helix-turn-helix transcriptional regulator n=1 Tax=Kutzneria chonburiensis TaxID=1483604 RepID=A0ABV6MSZ6_9PSEU|nr:helix-turn-helix transcriptional regulator [Kutzneria chonburiensis]